MQAIVQIPQELLQNRTSATFLKVDKNIYFDQPSGRFYKSTSLQPITAFIGNDLVTRANIVFTQFDPRFLILKHFSISLQIPHANIPPYLNLSQFLLFGDDNGESVKCNRQKIFQFLQDKINNVLNSLNTKDYGVANRFKLKNENTSQKRFITSDVIEILKMDIPEMFLDGVVMDRFVTERVIKPVCMDPFEEQEKKREKRNAKKSKPKPAPIVPKNQQTLFKFAKKQ